MVAWNVFRIIGDLSHTGSICVLLWAIHKNKSAEGSCTLVSIRLPRYPAELTDTGI